MRRRIAITIEYRGTAYCGWQFQEGKPTIQGILEQALSTACHEPIRVHASGRTDQGVHAKGQVAHFDTTSTIPAEKFPFAVNNLLPDDIKIVTSIEKPLTFHARYDVTQKTYIYRLYCSPHVRPLLDEQALQVVGNLDIPTMQKACAYLIGQHDFKCFQAEGSSVVSTVREIKSATLERVGEEVWLRISGKGFLYNMVRIIMGTLLDIGYGKHPPEYIQTLLESRNRELAGRTVSARGLCLYAVEYERVPWHTFWEEVSSITIYQDGTPYALSNTHDKFYFILRQFINLVKNGHEMPAFGVALHELTEQSKQTGIHVEFDYTRQKQHNGMPFEKLYFLIDPSYCGLQLERFNQGKYGGRCYYIDLQQDMQVFTQHIGDVLKEFTNNP